MNLRRNIQYIYDYNSLENYVVRNIYTLLYDESATSV